MRYLILPILILILNSCNNQQVTQTLDDASISPFLAQQDYIVNPDMLEDIGETESIRKAHAKNRDQKRWHAEWLFESLEKGYIDIKSFDQILSLLYPTGLQLSRLPENHLLRASPEYIIYLILKFNNPSFQMTNKEIEGMKITLSKRGNAGYQIEKGRTTLAVFTSDTVNYQVILGLSFDDCRYYDEDFIRLADFIDANGLKAYRFRSKICD